MAKETLDDIADIDLKTTVTTLTWSTTTDWDNLKEDKINVAHFDDSKKDAISSSKIQLGYSRNENSLEAYLALDENSGGSTAYDISGKNNDATYEDSNNVLEVEQNGTYNSTAYDFNGGDNLNMGDVIAGNDPGVFSFWWNPNQNLENGNVQDWFFLTKDKEYTIANQSNDGSTLGFAIFGDRLNTDKNTWTAGTWYHMVCRIDSANDIFEIYVDGTLDNSKSPGSSITSDIENHRIASGFSANTNVPDALMDDVLIFSDDLSQSQCKQLGKTSATVTTSTKSFSSPQTPDLQNLNYNLNNESINITVRGSPNTADEETITKTLDGSTSYTLSWSNSHTDFDIQIELDTTNVETSPDLSKIELVA